MWRHTRTDEDSDRVLGGTLDDPAAVATVMRHNRQVKLVGEIVDGGSVAGQGEPQGSAVGWSSPLRPEDDDVVAETVAAMDEGAIRISSGTAVNQRADRILLRVDGHFVELADAIEVVRGSREVPVHRLAESEYNRIKDLSQRHSAALDVRRGVFRSVAAGDRVRVFGRLSMEAARGMGGHYRKTAMHWKLYAAALACWRSREDPACVIPMYFEDSETDRTDQSEDAGLVTSH